jgi:hypothetical protein
MPIWHGIAPVIGSVAAGAARCGWNSVYLPPPIIEAGAGNAMNPGGATQQTSLISRWRADWPLERLASRKRKGERPQAPTLLISLPPPPAAPRPAVARPTIDVPSAASP